MSFQFNNMNESNKNFTINNCELSFKEFLEKI